MDKDKIKKEIKKNKLISDGFINNRSILNKILGCLSKAFYNEIHESLVGPDASQHSGKEPNIRNNSKVHNESNSFKMKNKLDDVTIEATKKVGEANDVDTNSSLDYLLYAIEIMQDTTIYNNKDCTEGLERIDEKLDIEDIDEELSIKNDTIIDKKDLIIKTEKKMIDSSAIRNEKDEKLFSRKEYIDQSIFKEEKISDQANANIHKSILSKENMRVDKSIPERSNILTNIKEEDNKKFKSVYSKIKDNSDVKKIIGINNINSEEDEPISNRLYTILKTIICLMIISLVIYLFFKYYPNNYIKRSLCNYTSICKSEKKVPARFNICLSENVELEHNNWFSFNAAMDEEALIQKKIVEEILAKKKMAEEALAKKKMAEEALIKKKMAEEELAKKKMAEEALIKKKMAEEELDKERIVKAALMIFGLLLVFIIMLCLW